MKEGWFSMPVPVSVGIIGDVRHISSARQALVLLTGNWRDEGSAKHRAAKRECLAAINGDATGETARQAFIAAAREARVLVKEDQLAASS